MESLSNNIPQETNTPQNSFNIDNIMDVEINSNLQENISEPEPEPSFEPEPDIIYDNMMMAPAGPHGSFDIEQYINDIDVTDLPSLRIPLNEFINQVRLRIAHKNYMKHLKRKITYDQLLSSSAGLNWCSLSDEQILSQYGGKYFQFVSQNESEELLEVIRSAMVLYRETGMNGRSSRIVDLIHSYIARKIKESFTSENFTVKLEQKVPSLNSSGFKRCDIVVYKNGQPYIILPFKLIRSSYSKNKNNYLENLTGELLHLVASAQQENREIYIIPINIIFSHIVDRTSQNIIRCIERITYNNTFKIYEELSNINISTNGTTGPLVYNSVNYILRVDEGNLTIGQTWDGVVTPIGFTDETPYRTWESILKDLL